MSRKPTIIDLFAGVGGLSLGAARAGFQLALAVDADDLAISQHVLNFPRCGHMNADVRQLTGAKLLQASGLKRGELDGLIGGPPCQGFSEIGHRSARDPRNMLFGEFFRLVAETLPAFFVAENVPGLLWPRHLAKLKAAMSHLPSRYRTLVPFAVRASDYGAPTTRTRIFFVGYDPDRLGSLGAADFGPRRAIKPTKVGTALCGLPGVRSHWQAEHESWRAVGEMEQSSFGRRVQGYVPPLVGNRDALMRYRRKRLVSGFLGTVHTKETVSRFQGLRPGDVDPVSGAQRLSRSGFCPTLRAGTGPERGSYQAVRPIHPSSPRVITPREAARLQGFPDWFVFHPTKWHAFRQIGNSVSPIVAESLLRRIARSLG